MPKKSEFDQPAKESLSNSLNAATSGAYSLTLRITSFFNKADKLYIEAADLHSRLKKLQDEATEEFKLPPPDRGEHW